MIISAVDLSNNLLLPQISQISAERLLPSAKYQRDLRDNDQMNITNLRNTTIIENNRLQFFIIAQVLNTNISSNNYTINMPTLVHLADERQAASIRKNGLKAGKSTQGIYCMPVMQNFYISHQWLRELKRFGGNTFVGVYFKIDSSQKVYAGRFNKPHKYMELGEAIKEIQSIADPLGYELIIDRKITAKEIQKIQHLPQTIGWRYSPGSNGQYPCGCDYCQRGKTKAKSVRRKYSNEQNVKPLPYTELLSKLKVETMEDTIETLLWEVQKKSRSSDPNELRFLLDVNSRVVDRELALTMKKFRHKNTKTFLQVLLDKTDPTTREYAADSYLKRYKQEAEQLFADAKDPAIRQALADWREHG